MPTITLYKAGLCPYCVAAARYLREVKGVGVEALWVQGALMMAYAALGLGLATRVFRKEIG